MKLNLQKKLDRSREFISRILKAYRNPCVLWSGGKDSMVMLHMVRELGEANLPVVCWREPWLPVKQTFANQIISQWNLTAWDWPPASVALTRGKGRIDVLNYYSWGPNPGPALILARGIEKEAAQGEERLCGRDTFLTRGRTTYPVFWDLAFHGHKSSDVDLIRGKVPLETDVMDIPGSCSCAFPLRDWTDQDIFAYTDHFSVPYDHERYCRNGKGWITLPYQKQNPDFYPACFKCCDPEEPDFVACPKLGGAVINNISARVPWEYPEMPYCNLKHDHALQS